MPQNISGITIGVSCWIQKVVGPLDFSFLDGIYLDIDGGLIGTDNIGLTVWENAVKKVQINSVGMALYGGSNVWLPDNYDPAIQSTWNGVVIGSSAIQAYKAGALTFEVTNVGDIVSYGGNFAMLPANYDPNTQSTWNGVVIGSSAIQAYKAGVKTFEISNVGDVVLYGGTLAMLPAGYDPADQSTWTGVIVNSTEILSYNAGILKAEINSSGMALYGGSNVWVPDNYDIAIQSTWNGVVIGSSAITAYLAGVKTFEISNAGSVVSYGGNFAMLPAGYDPGSQSTWTGVVINSTGILSYNAGVLKAVINSAGIALYGGTNVWVPDNYDPAIQSTWNGVRIKDSGIQAFKNGVLTFDISNAGSIASYGGNFAMLPIGYDPLNSATWNGVVINSAGIMAYLAGVKTLHIDNAGSFIFGSVTNKRFMFNGTTGAMTIEPGVVIGTTGTPTMTTVAEGAGRANTALNSSADYIRTISTTAITTAGTNPATGVIFDKDGLRGFSSSVKKFEINATTGSAIFSGDISGANIIAGGTLTLLNSASYGSKITIGDGGTISTGTTGQKFVLVYPVSDNDGGVLYLGGTSNKFSSIYTNVGSGGYAVYTYNIGGYSYQMFSMSPSGISFLYKTAFTISDYLYSEKFRIDASGNVGIGTTAPSQLLQIGTEGSASWAKKTIKIGSGGYSEPAAYLTDSYGDKIIFYNAGGYDARMGVGSMANLWFKSSGNGATVGMFQFFTGNVPTERMQIAGDGTVKIGTLSGTGNRAVYSDPYGNLTNSSSDVSLKKDIEPIPYGLDEILAFNPIIFNWKQPDVFGDQKEIGFGAQEIEAIIPELVSMNHDGTKSLDYPKITAVLCRAIQELNVKLETLNG